MYNPIGIVSCIGVGTLLLIPSLVISIVEYVQNTYMRSEVLTVMLMYIIAFTLLVAILFYVFFANVSSMVLATFLSFPLIFIFFAIIYSAMLIADQVVSMNSAYISMIFATLSLFILLVAIMLCLVKKQHVMVADMSHQQTIVTTQPKVVSKQM